MEEGLRFECQQGCTRCCNTRGFVYLTEKDVVRIAEYVGLAPAEFEQRYVYRTAHSLRLRKPRTSECPFLTDEGCNVHPVKPVQCRVYPFWPEYVEHRDLWNYEGEHRCPGIGTGPLVQIGTALEMAEEMRSAYPQQYKNR